MGDLARGCMRGSGTSSLKGFFKLHDMLHGFPVPVDEIVVFFGGQVVNTGGTFRTIIRWNRVVRIGG